MEKVMDLHYLYRAAESGNWDVIQQYDQHQLETKLTPNEDTVLHVLSRFCDSSFAFQRIIGRNPKLLLKPNADKETPLHIAARKGHSDIVRAIIDWIKCHQEYRSVLRSENHAGNTALHEAVKNKGREIIQLLVEEDPTLVNIRNGFGRSPLYLAAENGDEVVVALILSHKPDTNAPIRSRHMFQDKRNALHAAAIGNFPECIKLILSGLPRLAQETDEFGWMAIHYAARLNYHEMVRQMHLSDSCRGQDKALSIAVKWGHIQVIQELLTHSPGCWSTVTSSGKNVIHRAVKNEQQKVLNLILKKSWASELVNGRDKFGNTPLHFYVETKKLLGCELVNHPAVERNALNKDGFTPLDSLRCATHHDKNRKDFLRSELEKSGTKESRFLMKVDSTT